MHISLVINNAQNSISTNDHLSALFDELCLSITRRVLASKST